MKLHFLFSKPHIRAGLTLTLSKENTISFLPTKKKIDDYFLESCNLVAGRVKHGLTEGNSDIGISIPIKTKGFDDLFFTLKKA